MQTLRTLLAAIALGLCTLLLGACAAASPGVTAPATTWITSRGQLIPVTLTTPADQRGPVPLVLLIHGHGGTRHEAGGFTRVAQALAAQGIAAIRMDFPGCGDSTESFIQNNLSNMLEDVAAAQRYAVANANIDATRLGLLGFSMGGRLAISMANQGYSAMALWAPSAKDGVGAMRRYLGGAQAYEAAKEQARQQGYAPFTTFWGQQQQLGYRWFTDLEASHPEQALAEYQGALLVLYGDQDTVIVPAASRQVLAGAAAARVTEEQVLPGADHGLGLFNDDRASSELAVQSTAAFLVRELKR
ncbi:MAG: alpha/beta hydrolase family protein [Pseudomonadales bacterium]